MLAYKRSGANFAIVLAVLSRLLWFDKVCIHDRCSWLLFVLTNNTSHSSKVLSPADKKKTPQQSAYSAMHSARALVHEKP